MAVIKCKMCGGDLELIPDATVCECEYCGTRQTVPSADSEKKLSLFHRAGKLLRACEFDKAYSVYESIVAEFPDEAEAYWGLVLCKFGIEYVDDPATGKKVPTCHRSSFENVFEDENFEQACENADAVARRVYREEAKAIEELRRGIIEVSSKEEPYDIFISYKELSDDGDRTLDSVIAQDIYTELTNKGYRVFFSRISLEDKLGTEYEPYIFAALQSAKVMLVVGTDYDHFNAVWVKNEWSRFLALMASGQKKTLIPVFKDIDAYDMPKEFNKLAAQDMGKVGAMQDLLRGVEKILPLKKAEPATAAPQPVVVSGGPNVTALQKRGFMALEAGQWDAAKGFFDQVLNMDAENAEAYFGLALAENRCRNEAEFIRLSASRRCTEESKAIPVAQDRIEAAQRAYALDGFLGAEEIAQLFRYDALFYPSRVNGASQLLNQELSRLRGSLNFSRAFQFASGETAERLRRMREDLNAVLEKNLEQAKSQEQAARTRAEAAYAAHLDGAEKRASELRSAAEVRREQAYHAACESQAEANTIPSYQAVAGAFARFRDYRDSAERLAQCEAEMQKLREQEAQRLVEKQAADERRQAELQEQKAKRKKRIRIAAGALAAVIVLLLIASPFIKRARMKSAYDAAARLEEQGELAQAVIAFSKLGDYQDAPSRTMALWDRVAERKTIGAGACTMALRNTGTAVVCGEGEGNPWNVSGWDDLIAISVGSEYAIGLRADGTVIGESWFEDSGEAEVSGWTDIVSVSAYNSHTLGLKSDGTVVACGYNRDGQCDVSEWTDIVAVAAGGNFSIGVKADGTAVAVGNNDKGQCDVENWTDIVAVACAYDLAVGLRSDGTVVAAGNNVNGCGDVEGWKDITAVACAYSCTVGLKSDGTIVIAGELEDYDKAMLDALEWTDIVEIAAGDAIVGLKSDGTVVAAGRNNNGSCDVDGWRNMMLPKP